MGWLDSSQNTVPRRSYHFPRSSVQFQDDPPLVGAGREFARMLNRGTPMGFRRGWLDSSQNTVTSRSYHFPRSSVQFQDDPPFWWVLVATDRTRRRSLTSCRVIHARPGSAQSSQQKRRPHPIARTNAVSICPRRKQAIPWGWIFPDCTNTQFALLRPR
jgi:hypothetical protein